ncbi:hypothetical protein WMY93_014358 [Mugilogobius chulae]|uniref:HAT C-terminal dimerisation domain-containing protein n=1 Tax=Mugilogobius chulae TaxID=88201 RepID=A0AAW0NVC4_9GOBI
MASKPKTRSTTATAAKDVEALEDATASSDGADMLGEANVEEEENPNDLIEAVCDVIRNDIQNEIDAAQFIAIEVDETTDVTNKAQISVILRYVFNAEVKEAFMGFDDVSDDRRAAAISEYILRVLEKHKCVEKLVAQTYDGAAVMASELNGVQAKIKEKVPEAIFTHCYAHKLNLVLLHSAKCIPECKVFFKTVEGLGAFFSKSTKRTHLMDNVIKQRLPRAAATRWSSNSRLLQTISLYYSDLRELFHIINEHPENWDNDTLMMATGFDRWLSKASTCFFIMAYEGIFHQTDALFRVLQNKVMDIGFCCEKIRETLQTVEHIRQDFDGFYERFEQKCAGLGLTDNARGNQSQRDERKRMFYNILDNVSVQMKARFDHFDELAFVSLVNCTQFDKMANHFDDAKLSSLAKYARFFDLVRLKTDLIGLYGSQTLRNECKTPGQLLRFLAQNDLTQTIPEVTKLLHLILTIPATTASVERSFSALKRLKTYSRNKTDQGRLSSLATISIERERLVKLQRNKEAFYDKVTDLFAQKERRVELIYNQCLTSPEPHRTSLKIILNELRGFRQEIKAEFAKTNKRLDEAESRIEGNETKLQDIEEAVSAMLRVQEQLQEKLIDQECRSTRENIRIYGIPEGAEGSARGMVVFIENLLRENLGIPVTTEMHIERAHRALGPQPPPNAKPRSIIVRFQSYRMKEEVIRLAWQKKGFSLDNHKISLDHDYAPAILSKRKEYAEARHTLKENKIRFQTLYPARLRVHYDGGQVTYETVEEATADMASRGLPVKVIEKPTSLWERIQRGAWQTARPRRATSAGRTRSFNEKLQMFRRSSDNTGNEKEGERTIMAVVIVEGPATHSELEAFPQTCYRLDTSTMAEQLENQTLEQLKRLEVEKQQEIKNGQKAVQVKEKELSEAQKAVLSNEVELKDIDPV